MASISSRVSILHRLEFAPSLAGEIEDGRYQAVHLGDRRFDESQRLGEILRELLVLALEHRFGLRTASGVGGAAAATRPSAAIRLENVGAQFLEFAGEAHDVDQRRAQIVADDVGEALDFVVGLAKVGGALVDRGFEIEIVVAQLRFGVVAGARRAPHQKDRDARPARSRGRSPTTVTTEASRWVRSAVAVRSANRPVLFGPHRAGDVRRSARRSRWRSASRSIAMPPATSLRLTKSMALANSVEPGLDRRAQPFGCFRSEPDCRRSRRASLSMSGMMAATAASCSARKSRLGGQKIAARGAFGAADLQQQGRNLVFHLDGVHHPARCPRAPG